MSEIRRDEVHNYRPGPDSEAPLDEGEKVLATYAPDPRRYWIDAGWITAIAIVLVAVILYFMGNFDQLPIAAPAIVIGMVARTAWFRSEVFARRWRLTQKRLVGPQGRAVMLLEIKTVRRLMGDVQIVTTSGAKHLIKHLADGAAVVAEIEAARAKRAKVAR